MPFDPLKIAMPEPEKRRGRRGRRSSGVAGNSMSPQRALPIVDQGYNSGFNDIYGSGQGQPMNDQGFPGATYDQGDWGSGFDQGMRR